jgi:hypothetical protein
LTGVKRRSARLDGAAAAVRAGFRMRQQGYCGLRFLRSSGRRSRPANPAKDVTLFMAFS